MAISGWLITACWAILVGYWCIAAAAAVRTIGRRWLWWREITLRLGFFALVVLVLQIEAATQLGLNAGLYMLNRNTVVGAYGSLLCAGGVALAISARVSLGAQWAAPATDSKPTELLTTGPYAFARHPLYGGLLLAMLGSAIGQSVLWLLPLIAYAPGFARSARSEERLLTEQFSDRYRDYVTRTKMFVPFVY